MISSRRTERVWDEEDDLDDGYGPAGSVDLDTNRKRVGSVSLDGIPVIREEEIEAPDAIARPMATRSASNPSIAVLDASFPIASRSGSYNLSRPPSRLAESEGSWRSRGAGGHRHSISGLIPGPIVAGYQLKAVMGDFVVRKRDEAEVLEETLQASEGGRRRSGSLGVVLDMLGRRGRRLGEEEEEERE